MSQPSNLCDGKWSPARCRSISFDHLGLLISPPDTISNRFRELSKQHLSNNHSPTRGQGVVEGGNRVPKACSERTTRPANRFFWMKANVIHLTLKWAQRDGAQTGCHPVTIGRTAAGEQHGKRIDTNRPDDHRQPTASRGCRPRSPPGHGSPAGSAARPQKSTGGRRWRPCHHGPSWALASLALCCRQAGVRLNSHDDAAGPRPSCCCH